MSLNFPVSSEKQTALREKMNGLGIKESDLEEQFVKSSGNGGQNVNKVSTSVRLIHRPTGTEVKCSIYRTQGLNRYKARAILCEKLELKNNDNSFEKRLISNSKITKKIKQKNKKEKRSREKYKPVFNSED